MIYAFTCGLITGAVTGFILAAYFYNWEDRE